MRAAIITGPGGPENLQLTERPAPVPGPGEVLVEVAFCGLNWADTMLRKGTYPHPMQYPLVPGLEIAGRVVKLGTGVEGVAVGDRVAAFAEAGGGCAELCAVAMGNLIPLPDSVGLDVGAAFPIQALTVYHMLHTIARTGPGDTVLVHAIGGGVGLYATQLATHAGARVLGTVGTPGKERRALEFGAERVFLRDEEDFVAGTLELTGGRGVDLAIDSLGAKTLDRTFDAVRKLGHVISIGEAEGMPYQNIRERILPRSQTFTRFHLGHVDHGLPAWRAGIAHVLDGITGGWLTAPIDEVFPLERVAAMHARLESRQVPGKLLLAVRP